MTDAAQPPGRLMGFLRRRKYELLLFGLLQHLFIAVVLPDLEFYARWVWPLNMVILGASSVGIFSERSRLQRAFKNLMYGVVVAFPLLPILGGPTPAVMVTLSLCYVAFYLLLVVEVLRYLLRPSYINADLVLASLCGHLLLLETGIFLMQALHYALPNAFRGLDTSSFPATYLDLVYYCTITITSIGFGDITPSHPITKLATSILGLGGHFYSVVLIGVLISKYTSANAPRDPAP